MDLQAFLRLLKGVKGPNAKGDYVAKCPAHDDKTASLCVAAGEKGIVIKCQAGCTAQSVAQTMGISMKDLFYTSSASSSSSGAVAPPSPQGENAKRPQVAKKQTTGKAADDTTGQEPVKKKDPLGEIVCTYPYVDEDGKLLFEVVRFRQEDGGKTFRQRVKDASKPGGYRWSLEGVRRVIFHLPAVMEAIREDKPIFVVEGEKDCQTLEALGNGLQRCRRPQGSMGCDRCKTKGAGQTCLKTVTPSTKPVRTAGHTWIPASTATASPTGCIPFPGTGCGQRVHTSGKGWIIRDVTRLSAARIAPTGQMVLLSPIEK